MRSETEALIRDYQQHVVRAHRMICERLRIQRIYKHCFHDAGQPGIGFLDDANSIYHVIHRSFYVVNFVDVTVRVNFGEGGAWYGFTSYDLWKFAQSRGTYPEYVDLDVLKAELEALERNGELPLVPGVFSYAIPEELLRVPTS